MGARKATSELGMGVHMAEACADLVYPKPRCSKRILNFGLADPPPLLAYSLLFPDFLVIREILAVDMV